MTDIRKCAQAVIDNYELRHKFDMDVLINDLRQALADTPSVDALIAEAVAKEREACAQIAMDFWCDAGAVAIRARGQK